MWILPLYLHVNKRSDDDDDEAVNPSPAESHMLNQK